MLDDEVVQTFAAAAARYVERLAGELGVEIVRIGIDAPSAPRPESLVRREAERALDAAGISCFATPSASRFDEIRAKVKAHLDGGGPENRLPHANQLWMIVGFALFDHLSQVGECIEVFPQATARGLGAGDTHKNRAGGVDAQLRAVSRHTGWPTNWKRDATLSSIAWAPDHDCLDAYLSAWVAALEEEDRVPLGTPPDDVIWVPRLEGQILSPTRPPRAAKKPPRTERRPNRVASRPTGAKESPSGLDRLCPACKAKTFKRWPWGWDAHAAHTCTGISGSDPEERKREFKERFGQLF